MTHHSTTPPDPRTVIVGVDTHKHVHVAVAIDSWGRRLADRSSAADADGYQQLITWAEHHGRIAADILISNSHLQIRIKRQINIET